MSIIIPFCIICLFTLNISILFSEKFGKCIPFALMLITLITYVFGLFNNIKLGVYFICAISLLSLLILFINRKNIKIIIHNYFSVGFFYFAFLFLVLCLYHRYSNLFYWDEFMHWAPMAKNTYNLNAFYSIPESTLLVHKDYPPFVTLFEVFWCYIVNSFEERHLFRALSILSVSMFMPVIDDIKIAKNKNYIHLILFFFLFIFINMVNYVEFNAIFDTIYIDYFLAIIACYAFYSSSIFKNTPFNILNMFLCLTSLLMTKQMGIAFFILAIFLLFFRLFINKKIGFKITMILLLVIISSYLFYKTWDIYNSKFIINAQFSFSQLSLSKLIDIALYNNGKQHQLIAYKNYLNALSNKTLINNPFSLNLNYILLSLINTLVIFFINIKSNKKLAISSTISYLIGSIGYAFAMLLLYVFSFDSYEGPLLASYERYMNTYIYFGFSIIILYLVKSESKLNIALYMIILILFINLNYKNFKLNTEYNGYDTLEKNQRIFNYIDTFAKDEDKVLLISQFQDDLVWILRYRFPTIKFDVITLGLPKYEGDVYSVNLTNKEWLETMNQYNYLYTYFTDEAFYQDYWLNTTSEPLWNEYLYFIDQNKLEILQLSN